MKFVLVFIVVLLFISCGCNSPNSSHPHNLADNTTNTSGSPVIGGGYHPAGSPPVPRAYSYDVTDVNNMVDYTDERINAFQDEFKKWKPAVARAAHIVGFTKPDSTAATDFVAAGPDNPAKRADVEGVVNNLCEHKKDLDDALKDMRASTDPAAGRLVVRVQNDITKVQDALALAYGSPGVGDLAPIPCP